MAADAYTCQRCGMVMGPDAAQGLCPACLLQEGLRDSQAATLPSGATGNGAAELAELARVFPQLEILELVGRGGMGVVYKARQRGLDRLVAIKVLPPTVDRDPGFRERFVREARALARLAHPNIVAVYDFGQAEGRYYFLMEFVDGANLRKMLQAGHLTPQHAMAIVPQLCDALQFAHEEGIVHRDIKPENILVDHKGRVKIADFGLAKLLGSALSQDPFTLTGPRQVLGTPNYMAPEQLERPGTVDHRADIYSMGVVFYEMLTGELPLGRFPVPSRKVQIDVRLDEVVLRTLEKEPEQRYQHAGDVKTELASMAAQPAGGGGPPTWSARAAGSAHPRGSPERPPGPPRLSRSAVAGLLAALMFPIAAVVCALAFAAQPGTPSDRDRGVIVAIAAVWGVLSAVLSCALGLDGIRRIRRSGGRLYGLPLALADALLYPLVIYDVMIVALVTFLLDPGGGDPPVRLIVLGCVIALGIDALIIRWAWRRARRPLDPPPAPRMAPPAGPGNYEIPPKRNVGCLLAAILVAGAVAVALGIVLAVAVLVPLYQRKESPQAQQLETGQGQVRAEVGSDSGNPLGAHAYRFDVEAPRAAKTTVWAEVWRNGKLDPNPGFDAAQSIIPPAGLPFEGTVTFNLGPTTSDGRINAGWLIAGNAGSMTSENLIADPFVGLPARDSTWGTWTGSWSVAPGQPMQILAMRGAKGRLTGPPGDQPSAGHADGEIRLFVRFDPLTPAETRRPWARGEIAVPSGNGRPSTEPSTRPSPSPTTQSPAADEPD